MKKPGLQLIAAFAFLPAALITGCQNEKAEPSVNITQADLDAVTNYIGSATGGFAHGGPDGISADSTVREVFSSLTDLHGNIPAGTVIVKQTYKKGPDGNKTDTLYVTFAEVKRESGYDTDHQDWEYIMIPYDDAVDYDTHPFGILPSAGDNRGQLDLCIGCHVAAGGGDYIYTND